MTLSWNLKCHTSHTVQHKPLSPIIALKLNFLQIIPQISNQRREDSRVDLEEYLEVEENLKEEEEKKT